MVIAEPEYGPEQLITTWVREYRPTGLTDFQLWRQIHEAPMACSSKLQFRLIESHFEPGRPVLCLELHEDATFTDVERCWSLVGDVQKTLQHLLGRTRLGDNSFYEYLLNLHDPEFFGLSYGKIARLINRWIRDSLSDANSDGSGSTAQKVAQLHADDMLRLCQPRLTGQERQAVLKEMVDEIQERRGEDRRENWPVTAEDVKERIRYWRKVRGGEKIAYIFPLDRYPGDF